MTQGASVAAGAALIFSTISGRASNCSPLIVMDLPPEPSVTLSTSVGWIVAVLLFRLAILDSFLLSMSSPIRATLKTEPRHPAGPAPRPPPQPVLSSPASAHRAVAPCSVRPALCTARSTVEPRHHRLAFDRRRRNPPAPP